jgi:hypothetical protein
VVVVGFGAGGGRPAGIAICFLVTFFIDLLSISLTVGWVDDSAFRRMRMTDQPYLKPMTAADLPTFFPHFW